MFEEIDVGDIPIPSKWEKDGDSTVSDAPRTTWTTSHWQSTSERQGSSIAETTKSAEMSSGSVLKRLRMAQTTKPTQPTTSVFESPRSEEAQPLEEPALATASVSASVSADTGDVPTTAVVENTAPEPEKELSLERLTNVSAKVPGRHRHPSSTSGSVSSSSSSSCCSCTRGRSGARRSVSPSSRRRSDYSDSRSRGRGSYYGRYSPISRSRYSRSRSRSTYRSTINSAYSSGRTRRRFSSRSRSRSYTRDSRSPSSRWASSRHRRHRRGRRSHRHSGFRRSSTSRSSSSSRSYSSSPRRR